MPNEKNEFKLRVDAALRQAAERTRSLRVRKRILTIANVLAGMERDEAARRAGVCRKSVDIWIARFRNQGLRALHDKRHPGLPCKLTLDQRNELKASIIARPEITCRQVRELVQARFGVKYSDRGIKYLAITHLGFTWSTGEKRFQWWF